MGQALLSFISAAYWKSGRQLELRRMARREIQDDKKSYSGLFLFAVGLLLLGTVWTVWDDSISRRPWKKYQAAFARISYDKLTADLQKEDERLANDPAYQEATAQLAEAEAQISGGEGAERLAKLESDLAVAEVTASDAENALRLVRSEIEVAWYEYDHAIITEQPTKEAKEHLDGLEAEAAVLNTDFQAKTAQRDQIQNEIDEINLAIAESKNKLRTLASDRERLKQRLDDTVMFASNGFMIPYFPSIEQVVLQEFDRSNFDTSLQRVDRCISCHVGIDRGGFEDQPNPYKTHPYRKILLGNHVGCTPCHDGQGVATNSVAQAHGNVKFWEHPLLESDKLQANCIKCHANAQDVQFAENIAQGEKLFMQVGCTGCHLVEGYGEARKIAPYLRRVAAKADPSWLVQWVTNPHEFRPQTRMPQFFFNEDQGKAIAAYLLKVSKEEGNEWLASRPQPDGIDPSNPEQVEKGKALVNSVGCRGCHIVENGQTATLIGSEKTYAPILARIAEKTNPRWLYYWIRNPREYSPHTAMPSLRLTDDEAKSIVSYLMTLGEKPAQFTARPDLEDADLINQGEGLVRKYGCHGCHEIPGMEKEGRIGVELSAFGSKMLEELFFGNRTDVPHSWDGWTDYKIKEPRGYATERIEQIMPWFNLPDEDIKLIRVFLSSRTEGEFGESYQAHNEWTHNLVEGQRMVQYYNCTGCHIIENKGGDIRALYQESPTLAPPILNGQGEKVQPAWFYEFLKGPIPIRPWLEIRMPTFHFDDTDARTAVDYFIAQAKLENPYSYVNPAELSPDMLHAGEVLMSNDYFACFSCHQQGDQKPEGPPEGWAPDLELAKDRLNPEWVVKWIEEPQKMMPGTRMPSFYPGGPDDILDANEPLQMEAMRDYIWTLGQPQMAKLAQPEASPESASGGVETPVESLQPAPTEAPLEAQSEETAAVESGKAQPSS